MLERLRHQADSLSNKPTLLSSEAKKAESRQYPQPENLLQLIGIVSEMKIAENERIAKGEDIPDSKKVISLAGGLPYPKRLNELWENYYSHSQAELSKNGFKGAEVIQYGGSQGEKRMRTWAAEDITRLTGQEFKSEEIVTTPGLQYGISATLLALCAAKDRVLLTDNHTYSATLQAANKPITIPTYGVEMDDQGMTPENLEKTLKKLKYKKIDPGLVYTMAIGNPTGKVMSDERGAALNEICKKNDVPFFVDYAYYKLMLPESGKPEPKVSYADKNVLLGFTTSKTAAPGKRVGYLAFKDPELKKSVQDIKEAQLILSPQTNELEFWHLANRPDFDTQIDEVRKVYARGINTGLKAVENNSDVFRLDEKPAGGMFLYVKVPEGLSTSRHLGEILTEKKIAYTPGVWCQPRQHIMPDGEVIGAPQKDNYLRLCMVTESNETVARAISKLADAFREIAQREGVELFSSNPSHETKIFPQE